MAFTSELMPGELIITDSTPGFAVEPPQGKGRGLVLEDRQTPFGRMAGAPPFPRELLIPESEYQDRIKELEDTKTRLSDIVARKQLPCKDQGQTNYCWYNSPAYCQEVLRAKQGQKTVILSPASGAAKIKNYRNEGGWGEQAIEHMATVGLAPITHWPANHWQDSRYDTPETREVARRYRIIEWWELRPRDIHELMALLLRRIPVTGGYNWWGHQVTNEDPVWLDGTVAIRIRNSWGMNWPQPGARGYGILQGSRMLPDDQIAPRTAIAS